MHKGVKDNIDNTRSVEEEGGDGDGERRVAAASLGLEVEGSPFTDSS